MKQIYRLETGRIRSPDEFYCRLYCQFFQKSPQELFGSPDMPVRQDSHVYRLRSHKFVPVYVGAAGIERLARTATRSTLAEQWLDCRRLFVEDVTAEIFVWPCGVVMFHIVDELEPTTIADVAVWRRQSYPADMNQVVDTLRERGVATLSEPYVLSCYWVEQLACEGARRDIALRLLCIPRVLLCRDESLNADTRRAHAKLVEQTFMRDGFDHPDIYNFGVKGIATAYASWSGVVYHPRSPAQSLAESELVACELSVQAAWTYSDFVRQEVECGRDPVVAEEYGWRYLRGVRSRLTTERPQETSQHRAMREAVVSTSGLLRRLDQAIDALRDCDGR